LFGLPEAEIAKARADFAVMPTAPERLAIHPDNVRAVRMLEAMRTQWSWLALSTMTQAKAIRVGMKYETLDSTAARMGLGVVTGDDFARLQVLESAALAAWSEAAA